VTDRQRRPIEFETVFNFRDLGGYRTLDGRSLRWSTLYRADGLYRISPEDLDRLGSLGLTTVIDLRTDRERRERGCFPVEAHPVDYHHLPLLGRTWDEVGLVADGTGAFFAARYLEMLEEGASSIAAAIELLARPEVHPVVMHCSAGKDRTGALTAVVLALLGVDDETIALDYCLSGPAVVDMVRWLRQNRPELVTGSFEPQAETEAPRETMQLLLGGVRERYGSMPRYARQLGVEQATLDALRDRLLESRAG
jgi:protein-tyrosine phosphatase